ncbi:MAG: cell division GTPase [halophilic archaeon J07HX5]|jgi:Cell division GTPase|nr:MAG: cell division GTPase [halophilic archaeon J07HX5]
MKVTLIGVGQAGGKVTDAVAKFDRQREFGAVQETLAVNTAQTDLCALDTDTMLIGRDHVNGHGVGGDNELGAEIMQAESAEVLERLGGKLSAQTEAVVIIAGLGGGTGSGGAPALAAELRAIYTVPVYVLGILPGRNEGQLYQANAGRSLKTVTREATATILIDNDAWRQTNTSLETGFATINNRIARRVGLLFAAGEATDGVGESVVDSSEIIKTLANDGLASLGYANAPASADPAENIDTITSLARRAMLTGMSLPDAVAAEAALFVVAGQPPRIARQGVEKAHSWIEEETGSLQVRGGDFPTDSDQLGALVLLSGVERSDRVQAFLDRSRGAHDETASTDSCDQFASEKLDNLF